MNYNKAIIAGNLTRDPEMKGTPGGLAVCTFSIANNRRWKDKNGETKEETSFFEIVAFGGAGENIYKFFSKGDPIFLEGRIQQDRFEDKEGNKRDKVKIVAERFEFIPRKGDTARQDEPQRPSGGQPEQTPAPGGFDKPAPNSEYTQGNLPRTSVEDEDDVPF